MQALSLSSARQVCSGLFDLSDKLEICRYSFWYRTVTEYFANGSPGGSTFCECSAHPYTANAWILSMLRIVGYSLYCECSASLDTANARQTSLLLTLGFSLYYTSCTVNTTKNNKEVHICLIFECLPKAQLHTAYCSY